MANEQNPIPSTIATGSGTTPSPPTLTAAELIEEQENKLIEQLPRLASVRAIEAEIRHRVGEASFLIANEFVWLAMLDHRDMCVVHLASWVRGITEAGGFFGRLQERPAKELFVKQPGRTHDERERIVATERRRRFLTRFPDAATRGSLRHEDFVKLKDACWAELQSVVADRDSIRAHRYEKGSKANVQMLGVAELDAAFTYAQQLLNDLRAFASRTTLVYPTDGTSAGADSGTTAADLVDLLLFGNFNQLAIYAGATEHLYERTGAYWYELRDAFLERLKKSHAERNDPLLPINDPSVLDKARVATVDSRSSDAATD